MKKNQLLYYSIKYQGNYFKIKNALLNNEPYHVIRSKNNYFTILDKEYPLSLKRLKQPPYILYYLGDISLLKNSLISIVGSRNATNYGKKMTSLIVEDLNKDYTIVSGMALGIDKIAHQSALNTIAVLGSGINYVYPYSNLDLYNDLIKNHLVISEYPNFTKPKPYYFIARNRIVAALGEALIVTQATRISGTFSTVDYALDLGKNIYTIPYQMDDLSGSGCNYLLQEGASFFEFKK